MNTELESICELVRACGQFIKNADRSQLHVDAKGGHANFVTEYDKQVQERLRVGLREIMPDAHFVGEEGTTQAFAPVGKYFIVDPIDGTTNFIKDYHFSSISVALVVDNAAELGVIYNPYTDEMFYAQRGHGAFGNGKRLHVSEEPLENAIIVFGTNLGNSVNLHGKHSIIVRARLHRFVASDNCKSFLFATFNCIENRSVQRIPKLTSVYAYFAMCRHRFPVNPEI